MTMRTKGLTLIELVIVVGVLVFLALLFTFSLNASQGQVRDSQRAADIDAIQTAVEFYFNANGEYPTPTTEPGNAWGTLDDLLAQYMPDGKMPVAPKKSDQYVYVFNGDKPQHYVIGGAFEQGGNKNLLNDSDASFPNPQNWQEAIGVTSTGGSISSLSCGDPVYCVTD